MLSFLYTTIRFYEVFSMIDYKKNVCDNITYLRKSHNLSRNAMSKLIHVAPSTLDNMEKGILPKYFRLNWIYRTAHVFGLDPSDMMYPMEHKETAVSD